MYYHVFIHNFMTPIKFLGGNDPFTFFKARMKNIFAIPRSGNHNVLSDVTLRHPDKILGNRCGPLPRVPLKDTHATHYDSSIKNVSTNSPIR